MNTRVISEARQFSSSHFCNSRLSQNEFNNLIREQLGAYPLLEDQVAFLKEVIRLGNVFLNESAKVLQQMEAQDLSRAGTGIIIC